MVTQSIEFDIQDLTTDVIQVEITASDKLATFSDRYEYWIPK